MTLFEKNGDYEAFERVLARTLAKHRGVRLLTYCVMPNHWHLVLWPKGDDDLGPFVQRLTLTHTRRWQEHRHCHGSGHVYQGRYKSFPIQRDEHLWTVLRYVERNALRAKLSRRAPVRLATMEQTYREHAESGTHVPAVRENSREGR